MHEFLVTFFLAFFGGFLGILVGGALGVFIAWLISRKPISLLDAKRLRERINKIMEKKL